jgi:cold shock CspA family protein
VCQTVRRLGKRVALASIKGSCAPEFSDARDASHLRDFDMIWLDDLLDQLELRYEPHQLECQSSIHMGNRMVWTTFHPRKGQKFYCQECLASYVKQRSALEEEYVMRQNGQAAAPAAATAETAEAGAPATEAAETGVAETPTAEAPEPPPAEPAAAPLCGPIAHLVMERGFGFVRAPSGQDYFFHLTDLEGGVEFERLAPGMEVEFEIKREPSGGKAGAAHHVRVRSVPTDASIA